MKILCFSKCHNDEIPCDTRLLLAIESNLRLQNDLKDCRRVIAEHSNTITELTCRYKAENEERVTVNILKHSEEKEELLAKISYLEGKVQNCGDCFMGEEESKYEFLKKSSENDVTCYEDKDYGELEQVVNFIHDIEVKEKKKREKHTKRK